MAQNGPDQELGQLRDGVGTACRHGGLWSLSAPGVSHRAAALVRMRPTFVDWRKPSVGMPLPSSGGMLILGCGTGVRREGDWTSSGTTLNNVVSTPAGIGSRSRHHTKVGTTLRHFYEAVLGSRESKWLRCSHGPDRIYKTVANYEARLTDIYMEQGSDRVRVLTPISRTTFGTCFWETHVATCRDEGAGP